MLRTPGSPTRCSRNTPSWRGYLHQFDLRRIGHHGAEATVEMMESQLILILSGAFIGYLPAHYAKAWVDRGELRALNDAHYSYRSAFYVVTQRGGGENPLVNRFRAAALAASPLARPRWAPQLEPRSIGDGGGIGIGGRS
jgi:DNA-binding transcriptional LysR family regulator